MVVAVTTTLIMTMAMSMTVSKTMISFLWQQDELIDDPFFAASIVLEMLVLGAPLWQFGKETVATSPAVMNTLFHEICIINILLCTPHTKHVSTYLKFMIIATILKSVRSFLPLVPELAVLLGKAETALCIPACTQALLVLLWPTAVSQTTHSNAFSWMKVLEFRLRFHWSLFLGVQLTIFQHWFR